MRNRRVAYSAQFGQCINVLFLLLTLTGAGCAGQQKPGAQPAPFPTTGEKATAYPDPTATSQPTTDAVVPNRSELTGQIAFIGTDGSIWLLDLTRSNSERLTEGERVHALVWRPDGMQLAYVRETNSRSEREIVLLDLHQPSQPISVGLKNSMLAGVSWSPRGRYLLGDIGCCVTGRELLLLDPLTYQQHSKITYSNNYAWSQDEVHLAIGRDAIVDPPIPIENGTSLALVLVNVNTGITETVVPGTRESLYIPRCWITTNDLVYEQDKWETQQRAFWQMNIKNPTQPAELTTPLAPNCNPTYVSELLPSDLQRGAGVPSLAPDKQWAVVAVSHDGQSDIYVVNLNTHIARQVASGTNPVWRPDTSK